MQKQDYKTVRAIADIDKYIGDAGVIAFDFETSPKDEYRGEEFAALDAHKSDITGVSLSVKAGTGIYVPLRHRIGENADIGSVTEYLKKRLYQNGSTVKIAHNMAFEAMFLYKDGIVLQEPVYDTIVATQLTLKNDYEFRELSDSGLKTLVPYLYGVDLPKFEDVVGDKYFDELDPDDWDTCRYACADSDWALQLRDTFNAWFETNIPKHRFICEQIESPTAVFTGMMKYNGVLFDTELMEKKKAEAEEHLVELRTKIQEIIGDVDIGENCSTQAFKEYLYKTENLPVLKTTTKYAEAADDEAIQLLRAYCSKKRPELVAFFDTVQEFRKWAKIKSTYIDGYMKWINTATGRIHPDLMPMGTDTGRFASRKPNLQNMPRKGSDPIGVRQFVIAPDGTSFLDFDFSQIELRVGAFYCRDPFMMETYRTGGDIHASTTSVIFGISVEEAQDKD
jgi:DNA polymerase-1